MPSPCAMFALLLKLLMLGPFFPFSFCCSSLGFWVLLFVLPMLFSVSWLYKLCRPALGFIQCVSSGGA